LVSALTPKKNMDRTYKIMAPGVYVGSAPYDEQHFLTLINQGFVIFVDLTIFNEKFPDGTRVYEYANYNNLTRYHYPITDKRVPADMVNFYQFLKPVAQDILAGKKTYIHCRGGHGRSGLVAAVLLILCVNYNAEQALDLVYRAHQTRPNMNAKMRKLGAPQTAKQKQFVRDFYQYYSSL